MKKVRRQARISKGAESDTIIPISSCVRANTLPTRLMRENKLTFDGGHVRCVSGHHIVNLEPGFFGGDDDAAAI